MQVFDIYNWLGLQSIQKFVEHFLMTNVEKQFKIFQ